jgi:hypothetical protein
MTDRTKKESYPGNGGATDISSVINCLRKSRQSPTDSSAYDTGFHGAIDADTSTIDDEERSAKRGVLHCEDSHARFVL